MSHRGHPPFAALGSAFFSLNPRETRTHPAPCERIAPSLNDIPDTLLDSVLQLSSVDPSRSRRSHRKHVQRPGQIREPLPVRAISA